MYYFTLRGCLDADNQTEASEKLGSVICAAKKEIGGIAPYLHAMDKSAPVHHTEGCGQWPEIIIAFMHGTEDDRKRIAQQIARKGL